MPSSELPLDKEIDVDLSSEELGQILADTPAASKTKKSISVPSAEEEEEGGGCFEVV